MALPRYLFPLEYIQSNSKQYVPTDIYINRESVIECDIEWVGWVRQNYGGYNVVYWSKKVIGDTTYELALYNFTRNISSKFINGNTRSKYIDSGEGVRAVYKTSKSKFYSDDEDLGTTLEGNVFPSEFDVPLTFFGMNNDNTQDTTYEYYGGNQRKYHSSIKFYGCVIKENDIIVANLIPVYNTKIKECGLYNTVSKKFYANMDTTTTKEDFIHPEVPTTFRERAMTLVGRQKFRVTPADIPFINIQNKGIIKFTVKKKPEIIKSNIGIHISGTDDPYICDYPYQPPDTPETVTHILTKSMDVSIEDEFIFDPSNPSGDGSLISGCDKKYFVIWLYFEDGNASTSELIIEITTGSPDAEKKEEELIVLPGSISKLQMAKITGLTSEVTVETVTE